jgi:hypothetical protein
MKVRHALKGEFEFSGVGEEVRKTLTKANRHRRNNLEFIARR